MTADASALIWTALATIVFLLVPGVVYAYYVLARWIEDEKSYASLIAAVERHHSRTRT